MLLYKILLAFQEKLIYIKYGHRFPSEQRNVGSVFISKG